MTGKYNIGIKFIDFNKNMEDVLAAILNTDINIAYPALTLKPAKNQDSGLL